VTSTLDIHPVTPDRWEDMVELFERRGPRGGHQNSPAAGCWCIYWRDRSVGHGEPKKRRMAELVRAGREPGLLAYDDGVPVGWIAVAPREEYKALLGSPQYRPRDQDEGIWSIVCFTIDRYARRRGVAGELLAAAVTHAFERGALAIEGYPHVSKPEDYMGSVALYEGAGFERFRDANKRAIYRRGRQ
jgi:ribosomal protein S18 acetylase RimI-like enzyme